LLIITHSLLHATLHGEGQIKKRKFPVRDLQYKVMP